MATMAGRKAIKVIACWSHNLVDTEQAGLPQPIACSSWRTKRDFVGGVRWNSRESESAVSPKYWSPMLVFSGGSPESGLGSVWNREGQKMLREAQWLKLCIKPKPIRRSEKSCKWRETWLAWQPFLWRHLSLWHRNSGSWKVQEDLL